MATKKVASRARDQRRTTGSWRGPAADPAVECWRFALPRAEIGYVRCLLEAYEGLAQMDSEAGRAEIRWTVPRSRCAQARALARALAEEVHLVAVGDDHAPA